MRTGNEGEASRRRPEHTCHSSRSQVLLDKTGKTKLLISGSTVPLFLSEQVLLLLLSADDSFMLLQQKFTQTVVKTSWCTVQVPFNVEYVPFAIHSNFI